MDNNLVYFFVVIIILILLVLPILKKFTINKEQNINPINEAKVYLTYGREKDAIKILKEYLLENPNDPEAIAMLDDINKKNDDL